MVRLRNILGLFVVAFMATYAIFANPSVSSWSSFYYIKEDFTIVFLCSLLLDRLNPFLNVCVKGIFYWHLMTLVINIESAIDPCFFSIINTENSTGAILVFILITFLMLESRWIMKRWN